MESTTSSVSFEDLHFVLKQKEEDQQMFYDCDKVHRDRRTILVDWMLDVGCGAFDLSPLTVHIAISLFDRFIAVRKQDRKLLQLVACCCLLLAAKVEETDKIPSLEELNNYTKNSYRIQHFKEMEVIILHSLNWDLETITPSHFLNYYLGLNILKNDHFCKGTVDKALYEGFARYLIDLCVLEHSFLWFSPSLIAASVIFCTRRALGIVNKTTKTYWAEELHKITWFSEVAVEQCAGEVWNLYLSQNNSALMNGSFVNANPSQ
eukprot:TRINITY_DN2520_c0_g1_i1.p1 TRINITY_DN2520_c0_g1~~TRINITY_DN2520_c0_g1_i1.p1  ORF type:complete len:263 (+),score=39.64 TRINITY_DN2520_c0_g1_i1:156-944(+)